MNLEKMDKIIISQDEFDMLFEWKDNHKEFVRNFKPVLKEGVVHLIMNDGGELLTVFQDKDSHYHYTVFQYGEKVHELIWGKTTKIGNTVYSKMKLDSESEKGYNGAIISLHASLMAYMEYYSDAKEYVQIENVSYNKKKERKGKSNKKKSSVIRIRKKIYKVKVNSESIIRDKKRYERKCEAWTVSGHWRQMKSGKKVWIKPHVKGKGEITPKKYKL